MSENYRPFGMTEEEFALQKKEAKIGNETTIEKVEDTAKTVIENNSAENAICGFGKALFILHFIVAFGWFIWGFIAAA